MVNIQLEQNICAYCGALQSVVWGGPDGVDQRPLSQPLLANRQLLSAEELWRRELRAELELLEE